eukprot:816950-Rhodomonas_salina.1
MACLEQHTARPSGYQALPSAEAKARQRTSSLSSLSWSRSCLHCCRRRSDSARSSSSSRPRSESWPRPHTASEQGSAFVVCGFGLYRFGAVLLELLEASPEALELRQRAVLLLPRAVRLCTNTSHFVRHA